MTDDPWSVQDPPHDSAAEAAVLGALMLSATAMVDVTDTIRPVDFYRPAHATIFESIAALYERGEPHDPVTVSADLSRRQLLAAIGGAPYLHTLIRDVPTAVNASYYATRVRDQAIARRLAVAGERIAHLGNTDGDVADRVGTARALLDEVEVPRSQNAVRMGDRTDDILDTLDRPRVVTGMMTGWTDLDLILNPLDGGQLVVIGARPSIGKSVAGLDLAREAAMRLQLPAVYAALEMSADELILRAIAAEAGIPLSRLQASELTDDDWLRVVRHRDRINNAPLYVDDSGIQTLGSLRALVRRHRPRILVVDYLQLVTPPPGQNRREAMDALSRGFKLLAKTEDVIVVLLSQMNRKVEDRHDKRPSMADLRESGAIEQDADVVILLHRPEFYNRTDRVGEVDLIIEKQRNGPTGVATLTAQLTHSRFVDYSRGHDR